MPPLQQMTHRDRGAEGVIDPGGVKLRVIDAEHSDGDPWSTLYK